MPEIEIRSIEKDDFEILTGIEHDFQTDHVWQMDRVLEPGNYSFRFRESKLPRTIRVDNPGKLKWNDPDALLSATGLMASIKGQPVGYLFFRFLPETQTVWVMVMAVRKNYRRQGVGSALIFAVQDWCRKNAAKKIILEMQSKNYPGIRFAQKLGFEFCGYNDHYFPNQDIALFFARVIR
ncbi:MAG: GNAT family N-acetyltransferase [Chloroflexi bacterium]|nr:GNAT family N-acetyltransferase [Chloroflexota bacterium]